MTMLRNIGIGALQVGASYLGLSKTVLGIQVCAHVYGTKSIDAGGLLLVKSE